MIHDNVCLILKTKDTFTEGLRAGGGLLKPPHRQTPEAPAPSVVPARAWKEPFIPASWTVGPIQPGARSPVFTCSLFLRRARAPSIRPCLALITQEVVGNKHQQV